MRTPDRGTRASGAADRGAGTLPIEHTWHDNDLSLPSSIVMPALTKQGRCAYNILGAVQPAEHIRSCGRGDDPQVLEANPPGDIHEEELDGIHDLPCGVILLV